MPRPLFASICAAIGVLAIDALVSLWSENMDWASLVVLIDVAAIALFASLYRRNPKITEWARSRALVWGLIACLLAMLRVDPSDIDNIIQIVGLAIEGVTLLILYFVLRSPS